MIDKITSVFDNYSGKIKNPFIGTIISVWLIHNWRIPYALFNFDKDCTMQDKINFIADYFGKQNFWCELIKLLWYSLLVLVFTFILMAISRGITNFYYKVIEPLIITFIDKNEILTNEKKIFFENQIKDLENNINGKRDEITRVESNNQILKLKREQVQNEFDSYIDETNKEKQQLQDMISSITKINEATKNIINKYDEVVANLNNNEKESVLESLKKYGNNEVILFTPTLNDTFLDYGFLKSTNDGFKVTVSGNLFFEYFVSTFHKISI